MRLLREMAEERIKLVARLDAIAMWNIAGKTIDELTEVEIDKIETKRKLRAVEDEISAYIQHGEGETDV